MKRGVALSPASVSGVGAQERKWSEDRAENGDGYCMTPRTVTASQERARGEYRWRPCFICTNWATNDRPRCSYARLGYPFLGLYLVVVCRSGTRRLTSTKQTRHQDCVLLLASPAWISSSSRPDLTVIIQISPRLYIHHRWSTPSLSTPPQQRHLLHIPLLPHRRRQLDCSTCSSATPLPCRISQRR